MKWFCFTETKQFPVLRGTAKPWSLSSILFKLIYDSTYFIPKGKKVDFLIYNNSREQCGARDVGTQSPGSPGQVAAQLVGVST